MKKVINNHDRKKLNEGRNFGIGFSILQKKGSNYETLLPFTACKDYLNDFIYCELEKREIGKIHGYNHEILNCFDNRRVFKLGVNTLHYNNGAKWNQFNNANEILKNNKNILLHNLNLLNSILKVKSNFKIEEFKEGLIITCPIFYSKRTWLISMLTFYIRTLFNSGIRFENKEDLIIYLKENKAFIQQDNYLNKNLIDFINYKTIYLLKEYSFFKITKETKKETIHNYGMVSYTTFLNNNGGKKI